MGSDALGQLDPGLPGLAASFDEAAVASLFQRHWPGEHRARPVQIDDCTLADAKYEPGRRCLTTYRLRFRSGDGPPSVTVGVVEIVADGRLHRLYTEDPALPGLTVAARGGLMWSRLAGALGHALDSCTVTPVRYRPGQRAVLRYDIRTGGRPTTLFGKVLATDGERLALTLATLNEAARDTPGMPNVCPPVAWLPELQLVVQPAAPGASVAATLFDGSAPLAARLRVVEEAGRCLAALHSSSGAPGPRLTLHRDALDLRSYVTPMAHVDPAVASRVRLGMDHLASLDADAGPLVPGHGSFRADHVLVDGGRPAVVDLDGFGWSEPPRDVGNLLAYLRWKAVRQPRHNRLLAQARRAFLTGYAARGGSLDESRLAAYEAVSMLRIAGRRYRNLAVAEWPDVPRLVDAALNGCAPVGAP